MSKSGNSNIDHSRKKVKCWLFPQTRARIISKDYKKGKYYNKKVKINIIINYTIGLAFPLLLLWIFLKKLKLKVYGKKIKDSFMSLQRLK